MSPPTTSTADRPIPPDDLAAGLDRVWARLTAAVADSASLLRTPVVATVSAGMADGRVMVLRGVDRDAATLTFFTDMRAAKVAAVAACVGVGIVAYDPGERLQLRLQGQASIALAGSAVDAAWLTVPVISQLAYRTVAHPGTPAVSSVVAGRLAAHDGRCNFALLTIAVVDIEWLELAIPDHRRAHYRRVGDRWEANWCVP